MFTGPGSSVARVALQQLVALAAVPDETPTPTTTGRVRHLLSILMCRGETTPAVTPLGVCVMAGSQAWTATTIGRTADGGWVGACAYRYEVIDIFSSMLWQRREADLTGLYTTFTDTSTHNFNPFTSNEPGRVEQMTVLALAGFRHLLAAVPDVDLETADFLAALAPKTSYTYLRLPSTQAIEQTFPQMVAAQARPEDACWLRWLSPELVGDLTEGEALVDGLRAKRVLRGVRHDLKPR